MQINGCTLVCYELWRLLYYTDNAKWRDVNKENNQFFMLNFIVKIDTSNRFPIRVNSNFYRKYLKNDTLV